jgi:methylene-fatty-acyl-phospholipid synthase
VLETHLPVLVGAAALLSLERLFYVGIVHTPERFRAWFARGLAIADPVSAVERLFCGFKLLQLLVFAWWCYAFGGGPEPERVNAATVLGLVAIAAGQGLNASVFYRLGRVGAFYGAQFGRAVPWSQAFPFSVFKHPQYVGTVTSIWGLFLVARFPAADWWVLPAIETVYYTVGARLEHVARSASIPWLSDSTSDHRRTDAGIPS